MPDITMCANLKCPKRETCHRATATPSDWQSYAHFKPNENGDCEHYWDNKKKEKRND